MPRFRIWWDYANSCPGRRAASSGSASVATGLVHGLKLVAVAIVAQAVWGMARTLCPDLKRAAIATLAAVAVSAHVSSMMQVAVLLCGGQVARAADPDRHPGRSGRRRAHEALVPNAL